jgi:hypothetical protein
VAGGERQRGRPRGARLRAKGGRPCWDRTSDQRIMRKDAYFFSSVFNTLYAYFCGVLQSV